MDRDRNRSSRREPEDEGRSSRRESSRGEERGSRDRDEGRRERGSDREERSSRGGDREERSSRRGGDDERSSRSSGRSGGYEYQARSAESVRERSTKGANDFDKIVIDGIKNFKPSDGDNCIRILPPTWKKPDHYGYDIFVHYGVGPDRQSYLCLNKMKDEADPIYEEYEIAKRDAREGNKEDEQYVKDLAAKKRCGVWLIDRNNEKEGVQFWAMPWTMDRDIVKVSIDKKTGEVLPIDHPEEGYDVEFDKSGKGARTEYGGVAISRRSSPLGNDKWLDYAMDHPIPEILQYFDYDHIKKAFGGTAAHRDSRGSDDRDDDRGSRGSSRGGRDEERSSRGSDRDERPSRGSSRDDRSTKEEADLTYETIHEMTGDELDDLIEQEKLDINPKEAKDDADLADWICEEMKLKPAEKSSRRESSKDADPDDRLAKMRERRRD